jgi:hypothetical protein
MELFGRKGSATSDAALARAFDAAKLHREVTGALGKAAKIEAKQRLSLLAEKTKPSESDSGVDNAKNAETKRTTLKTLLEKREARRNKIAASILAESSPLDLEIAAINAELDDKIELIEEEQYVQKSNKVKRAEKLGKILPPSTATDTVTGDGVVVSDENASKIDKSQYESEIVWRKVFSNFHI